MYVSKEGIKNTSLDRTEGRIDIRITTVRYLLQHPTSNNGYNILQITIKKKKEGPNSLIDNELNRFEHIPPQSRRIHILLILSLNILKDRPCIRSQNKC